MKRFRVLSIVASFLLVGSEAAAATLPAMSDSVCAKAKAIKDLVWVERANHCDRDKNNVNDCVGKNPFVCSLLCKGLDNLNLDANMRMPIDMGDGTCARRNLAGTIVWRGEIIPGNDRPGENYLDPSKPMPTPIQFGMYKAQGFYMDVRVDYCDVAFLDLKRCADERDELKAEVARLKKSGSATATATSSHVDEATLMALNAESRRIEAAKRCNDQGRTMRFGGNETMDKCEEPATVVGAVKPWLELIPVLAVIVIAFIICAWKIFQLSLKLKQVSHDLYEARENARTEGQATRAGIFRSLGISDPGDDAADPFVVVKMVREKANLAMTNLARIAKAVGAVFNPADDRPLFDANLSGVAEAVEIHARCYRDLENQLVVVRSANDISSGNIRLVFGTIQRKHEAALAEQQALLEAANARVSSLEAAASDCDRRFDELSVSGALKEERCEEATSTIGRLGAMVVEILRGMGIDPEPDDSQAPPGQVALKNLAHLAAKDAHAAEIARATIREEVAKLDQYFKASRAKKRALLKQATDAIVALEALAA